ncbi:MAG: hypothetical protein ACXVW5_32295 [Solirubrobacteraceae bacterium]
MRRRAAPQPDHPDLVDEMLERYIIWREQRTGVQDAYATWRGAAAHDRERAFHAYAAALDREQLAAEEYQRAVELSAAAAQGAAPVVPGSRVTRFPR